MKRCYYEILEIERTASEGEIKQAYRKMALQYHPDRNDSHEAEERFKEASEAYEVLSDQDKRAIYDRFGHQGLDQRGMHHGYADVGDIFSHFSDIFEDFFGMGGFGGMGRSRRGRRGGARPGRDLAYDLELDFMEAYQGVEKKFEIQRPETCEDCGGRGIPEGAELKTCPQCGGHGQLLHNQGFITISTTCGACHGQGRIPEAQCETCSGQGTVMQKKNLKVKVPAGVEHGMQLCLRGEGEAGRQGGSAGDLYVVLHVYPHERYAREGLHLVVRQEISMVMAALGAELEIEVPEGSERLNIPAGTQTGDVLKLKGLGMPEVNGRRQGDLLVQVLVVIPKKLNQAQQDLLRQLGESMGEEGLKAAAKSSLSKPKESSKKKPKKSKRSWF